MPSAVAPYRFSVHEFHRMGESGIFHEDDRVELIEGEIVQMTPIGSRHGACVKRFTQIFATRVQDRGLVSVQDPVILGDLSEPQPDFVVLRPRDDFYAERHPGPDDVLLLVEVSDTTQAYDRGVKVPLYAKHGIPEVWLVDLPDGAIEVYRDPTPSGYAVEEKRRRGDELRPVNLPQLAIAVTDVLGD